MEEYDFEKALKSLSTVLNAKAVNTVEAMFTYYKAAFVRALDLKGEGNFNLPYSLLAKQASKQENLGKLYAKVNKAVKGYLGISARVTLEGQVFFEKAFKKADFEDIRNLTFEELFPPKERAERTEEQIVCAFVKSLAKKRGKILTGADVDVYAAEVISLFKSL